VHDRIQPARDRLTQHKLGGGNICTTHLLGATRVKREDRRRMHDGVATLDGARHHSLIQDISHNDVADIHPQRVQRCSHLLGSAHKQAQLVPRTRYRCDSVATHKASTTGNQDLHVDDHAPRAADFRRAADKDRHGWSRGCVEFRRRIPLR